MMIQVIGFLGTIIFFLPYQCKSNKNLFRVQFISYFLYTIHLLMLGVIADQFATMDHIQYISWFVGRNYG